MRRKWMEGKPVDPADPYPRITSRNARRLIAKGKPAIYSKLVPLKLRDLNDLEPSKRIIKP